MQTFLPYPDFVLSTKVLDSRRLGKQRVESRQILNALHDNVNRWRSHPAVRMWKGCEDALVAYSNECITEWINRGYNNNMPIIPIHNYTLPWWFGVNRFHDSHKAALLFKAPDWYQKFGWNVEPKIEYWWPVK